MWMVHFAIFIPLLWFHTVTIAGFTQPVRWPGTNLVIEQDSAGTWCFLPVAGETTAIDCKGSQADLQGSMTAHLAQKLSIAYYNPIDNTQRGGATWSITNTTELLHLCASGKGGDGIIQTICSTVTADNQFSGTPDCEVALGPPVVSDGCYSNTPTTTAVNSLSSRASTSSQLSSPTSSSQPNGPTSSSTTSLSADSKTSSTASSSETTINVITGSNGPTPTNPVTEVFVPILCALIGVVGAVAGVKKYRSTRSTQLP